MTTMITMLIHTQLQFRKSLNFTIPQFIILFYNLSTATYSYVATQYIARYVRICLCVYVCNTSTLQCDVLHDIRTYILACHQEGGLVVEHCHQ